MRQVYVQKEGFSPGAELDAFTRGLDEMGAVVSFSGIVRGDNDLAALEIEHYPGMTQTALEQIAAQAQDQWSLGGCLIIHRFGHLQIGEAIMMVATAAPHRADAFSGAEFMMDFLKSRAPFWKREVRVDAASWVAQKTTDEDALARWHQGD